MTKRKTTYSIRLKKRIVVILSIIFVLLGVYYFLLSHYTVRKVTVQGNMHYTSQEIEAMVMKGRWGDNSLYLSALYSEKEIKDIPFIEKMDVEIVSSDTIKIMVYEKLLAGYIEYLGRYMYFDNEGTIVEVSKITTNGIPRVTGLDFDYVELYQKLPVENENVFKTILSITKLVSKYKLQLDQVAFDKNYNITLFYDDIKVLIGKNDNLEDKIMQLPYILPKLEGQKGTLDISNYSKDRTSITFQKDR